MWIDVSEFHRFYASELGTTVQQIIEGHVHHAWPSVDQQSIASYGYAVPYLESCRPRALRVFNMMPAAMGVIHWPTSRPNLTVLCEETNFPLADQSIDKLLMIHALEFTATPRDLLREVWRVLIDGGHLLIVVPNRLGLWARSDDTPFGYGQPYIGYQLARLLTENSFIPKMMHYSLFTPPSVLPTVRRLCDKIEHFGKRWCPGLGGVVVIQATKTVLATVPLQPVGWQTRIFIPQPCHIEKTS